MGCSAALSAQIDQWEPGEPLPLDFDIKEDMCEETQCGAQMLAAARNAPGRESDSDYGFPWCCAFLQTSLSAYTRMSAPASAAITYSRVSALGSLCRFVCDKVLRALTLVLPHTGKSQRERENERERETSSGNNVHNGEGKGKGTKV